MDCAKNYAGTWILGKGHRNSAVMIDTTIVVVPRESFSLFPNVVRQIYDATSSVFQMRVMEGRSPDPVRAQLLDLAQSLPNCSVVLSDHWRFPHDIVNEAISLVETEFVVFVDNDVEVKAGAIDLLLDCARRQNAECVHPLYISPNLESPNPVIHVAQGKIIREVRNGGLYARARMCGQGEFLENCQLPSPAPSDFFEWHCVLFRKSLLDRVGPLDALTVHAHVDYSMRIGALGESILLEPRAIVAYDPSRLKTLCGDDRDFLLFRWDINETTRSLERFRAKWNLAEDATLGKLRWATARYERLRRRTCPTT